MTGDFWKKPFVELDGSILGSAARDPSFFEISESKPVPNQ